MGSAHKGSNRVKRGGSWNNNASNCRSANRNNNHPSNRNNNLGFRLCSTCPFPDRGAHGFCRPLRHVPDGLPYPGFRDQIMSIPGAGRKAAPGDPTQM
ncbi:MAG: SUMF1/EgtB/PvdO family nonheme iron enzyme [Acidobacteriota bacterium]|nr:SUMF1/EgtB/PvdO family nonheme iron enzyme [Acidobacteriota bacterium]